MKVSNHLLRNRPAGYLRALWRQRICVRPKQRRQFRQHLSAQLHADLGIPHNPRNGQHHLNTALFTPERIGAQACARRRFVYGPGINDF
jgi:hypothetical protein